MKTIILLITYFFLIPTALVEEREKPCSHPIQNAFDIHSSNLMISGSNHLLNIVAMFSSFSIHSLYGANSTCLTKNKIAANESLYIRTADKLNIKPALDKNQKFNNCKISSNHHFNPISKSFEKLAVLNTNYLADNFFLNIQNNLCRIKNFHSKTDVTCNDLSPAAWGIRKPVPRNNHASDFVT